MNSDFMRYADFYDDDWIRMAFDSQDCDRFGHKKARYGNSEVPLDGESDSSHQGISILNVGYLLQLNKRRLSGKGLSEMPCSGSLL
jgi:hypothetical protein